MTSFSVCVMGNTRTQQHADIANRNSGAHHWVSFSAIFRAGEVSKQWCKAGYPVWFFSRNTRTIYSYIWIYGVPFHKWIMKSLSSLSVRVFFSKIESPIKPREAELRRKNMFTRTLFFSFPFSYKTFFYLIFSIKNPPPHFRITGILNIPGITHEKHFIRLENVPVTHITATISFSKKLTKASSFLTFTHSSRRCVTQRVRK